MMSVKLLDSGNGSDTETDTDNKKLEVDMKVEARYRGKSKYYPGVISRVRLNGTVDINYDDGEKELGVKPDFVRVLYDKRSSRSSSSRSPSRGRSSRSPSPPSFFKGGKVESRYQRKSMYYPGTITKVNRDGTFDVSYDSPNKDKERNVKAKYIKAVATPPSSPASSVSSSPRNRKKSKSPKKRGKNEDDMRNARLDKFEGRKVRSKRGAKDSWSATTASYHLPLSLTTFSRRFAPRSLHLPPVVEADVVVLLHPIPLVLILQVLLSTRTLSLTTGSNVATTVLLLIHTVNPKNNRSSSPLRSAVQTKIQRTRSSSRRGIVRP